MTVYEFPSELKITGHSLTAADNAGQEVLPFSGTVQRLAATHERFRGTWSFKAPKRSESLAVEAFLMKIGSGRGLFRTTAFQPTRNDRQMSGAVNGAHDARARTIAIDGLPPNRTIPAGEWVQIGWQAAKLLDDCHVDSSGSGSFQVFPFLHAGAADGDAVKVGRWVKILWRRVGPPVNWSYHASRHHSLEISLEAIQEIVTGSHDLIGEEVPA